MKQENQFNKITKSVFICETNLKKKLKIEMVIKQDMFSLYRAGPCSVLVIRE